MKRPRLFEKTSSSVDALTRDLISLYERARQEEEDREQTTTDCKLIISGNTFFAHSAILLARSAFFQKALMTDMIEKRSGTIEVRHVSTDIPKAAVHALLRFLYAGNSGTMEPAVAWSLLDLIGGDEFTGGFLGLTGCGSLHTACADAILAPLRADNLVDAVCRAEHLPSYGTGLCQVLVQNAVYHLKFWGQAEFLQLRGAPNMMSKILEMASACMVVRNGWRPVRPIPRPIPPFLRQWDLILDSSYPGLVNTAAALKDAYDMTSGVGTRSGCIAAVFDHAVTVSSLHLAISDMGQDWSLVNLNGAKVQVSQDDYDWEDAALVDIPSTDEIHEICLPQVTTAKYWRISYGCPRFLGLTFWGFEPARPSPFV